VASTWGNSWLASWAVSWDRSAVTPPTPTPDAGAGGGGGGFRWKGRPKGRNQSERLFDQIEKTLRSLVDPPQVHIGTDKAARMDEVDVSKGIDEAIKQLAMVSEGYEDLSFRLDKIRKQVAAYEKRLIDEDDDDFFKLMG